MPTPIVYGDYFYACNNQGILTCYNAKNGERIYQQRIGEGGAYSASPVAADGKLYFSSEDGDVAVVKAGPKYELLSMNPVGEVIMATPAISGGMLFIRTQHHVFGIAEKKGN
jgi:outer membrane protein assembly factor BamB